MSKPLKLSLFGLIRFSVDPRTYTPSHGPQKWTPDMARYYVSVVPCVGLLREDRERATHFSFNIWIYSRRGAWVSNLSFRNGCRRYGVEPRTPRPFGGMEVGEFMDALSATLPSPADDVKGTR